MTERERFKNKIQKSLSGFLSLHLAQKLAEKVTDALLAVGAMFPPCKVGDTAYFVIYDNVPKEWYISAEPIVDVTTKGFYTSGHEGSTENGDLWLWSDVGDGIYFSDTEAEKALQEAKKGDWTDEL